MQLTFNQIGHDIPTFADAAAVADLITEWCEICLGCYCVQQIP